MRAIEKLSNEEMAAIKDAALHKAAAAAKAKAEADLVSAQAAAEGVGSHPLLAANRLARGLAVAAARAMVEKATARDTAAYSALRAAGDKLRSEEESHILKITNEIIAALNKYWTQASTDTPYLVQEFGPVTQPGLHDERGLRRSAKETSKFTGVTWSRMEGQRPPEPPAPPAAGRGRGRGRVRRGSFGGRRRRSRKEEDRGKEEDR